MRRPFPIARPGCAYSVLFGFALFCLGLLAASAHDSLYNYVEIRIEPAKGATVSFSVHGPELAVPFGVNPLEIDDSWIEKLTPNQAERVMDDARQYIHDSFRVFHGTEDLLLTSKLQFPSLSEARHSWKSSEGARPGTFVGTLFVNPIPDELTFDYHNTQKRLMLVVTRPSSFPKVFDIAPGQSRTIALKIP